MKSYKCYTGKENSEIFRENTKECGDQAFQKSAYAARYGCDIGDSVGRARAVSGRCANG